MLLTPMVAGILLAAAPSPADTVRSAEELIRAMHARHSPTWYRKLSFVQRVTYSDKPDEEWWEAGILPGQLRIDIEPADSGNTILYRNDSLYRFTKRQVTTATVATNWLLVLGFDVNRQPAEKTIAMLKAAKFDLSTFRLDSWEGRPAYVVGAKQGDEHGLQFWVDRDLLLFVRLIQPQSDGSARDVRFNKYEKLGGGWIAPEVVFVRGGKEYMREVYREMRADPPEITDDLFAGPPWKRPAWVPPGK